MLAACKDLAFYRKCNLRKNVSARAYCYTRHGGDKALVVHDLEIVTWLILPVAYACLKD